MPENIRCEACGVTLLGIAIENVKPIDRADCPKCGGAEFTVVTRENERDSTDQ